MLRDLLLVNQPARKLGLCFTQRPIQEQRQRKCAKNARHQAMEVKQKRARVLEMELGGERKERHLLVNEQTGL